MCLVPAFPGPAQSTPGVVACRPVPMPGQDACGCTDHFVRLARRRGAAGRGPLEGRRGGRDPSLSPRPVLGKAVAARVPGARESQARGRGSPRPPLGRSPSRTAPTGASDPSPGLGEQALSAPRRSQPHGMPHARAGAPAEPPGGPFGGRRAPRAPGPPADRGASQGGCALSPVRPRARMWAPARATLGPWEGFAPRACAPAGPPDGPASKARRLPARPREARPGQARARRGRSACQRMPAPM